MLRDAAELVEAQRKTIGLNRGSRLAGANGPHPDSRPTLAEAGISKDLAKRIR
jgi:hypothetical protein